MSGHIGISVSTKYQPSYDWATGRCNLDELNLKLG